LIDQRATESFWQVVRACLIQFHRFSKAKASEKVLALRKETESPPPGLRGDLIYHEEPFYVACDIAKEQLDISEYRYKYDAILNRYWW
jgi:hypothetical protein